MKKSIINLSFPKGYFQSSEQYPLTPSMIAGLKSACAKQTAGELFGPIDIKKSTSLIRRGLLVSKLITIKDKTEILWLVSKTGIKMLRELGIRDKC